jgi:hypothetical protein
MIAETNRYIIKFSYTLSTFFWFMEHKIIKA